MKNKKYNKRFPDVDWFCDRCNSSLSIQDGFNDLKKTWKCTECGYINSVSIDNIIDGEYEYIYNSTTHSDNIETIEPIFGEVYDDVYDEDGDFVNCICGGTIKWKDGVYICPDCGEVLNRAEFFNHIGAEPPGPECLTCANLYPGCIICPHGYVED